MIQQYINAVLNAFGGVLGVVTRLALPLAIGAAVAVVGLIWAVRQGNGMWGDGRRWRVGAGYALISLLAVAFWSALRVPLPIARKDLQWRESAEATANPVPDAPGVVQSGPSVAAISEHTFTRTLTLPPSFLDRLGADGLGILTPYLSDPSAEGVTRLADTFKRSGRDAVFTREVTRQEETPLAFANSQVQANFKRLTGRAYDMEFEGRYSFANTGKESINARFTFPLPEAGTIRELAVTVNGVSVAEPGEAQFYQWNGTLAPGERRDAVAKYRVIGAKTWTYDIGSRRRRVEQFQLEANTGGLIRFPRGSLQPSVQSGQRLRWDLSNVVTAQQVALVFPLDVAARNGFLQALGALPAAFGVFLLAALLLGFRAGRVLSPGTLAVALGVFAFGLGCAPVLANYIGFIAGVLLGPIVGAVFAVRTLGTSYLFAAVPAALLPAAFLSPTHSGLFVLILAVVLLAGLLPSPNKETERSTLNRER